MKGENGREVRKDIGGVKSPIYRLGSLKYITTSSVYIRRYSLMGLNSPSRSGRSFAARERSELLRPAAYPSVQQLWL
jgi:hypothetical protein